MINDGKKPDGKRRESKTDPTAGAGDGSEDIKIVELGMVEDDETLLDEVSIHLDSLAPADAPPPAESGRTEAGKASLVDAPPPAAADGQALAPAEKPAPSSFPAKHPPRADGGAGGAVHRQRSVPVRARSAAVRTARKSSPGKRLVVYFAAAGLLIALGAAAGFYLFRPEPPHQGPVNFSVQNTPAIRIEAQEPGTAKTIALAEERNDGARPDSAGAAPETERPRQTEPAAATQAGPPEAPEAEIRLFLASWKAAWEESAGKTGRIDPYIAHYSKDFTDGAMDFSAWKADKAAKNQQKEWIRVDIQDVRVEAPAADGSVAVRFFQTYDSSNYSDQTEKTLILIREKGGWKIRDKR